MADEIAEHAPAKVNLALHVTGRREDGYHLLETLAVFTHAGDRVSVKPAPRDRFTVTGPFAPHVPQCGDNLVTRARDLVRSLAGSPPAAAITLEKHLPVASGLGGGSSDAAAALRALCRLWRLNIAPEILAAKALALGADVPMCLAGKPLIARGIGERLEALPGLPALALVLVNPGVAVSTPSIFAALESRDSPPLPPLPVLPGLHALAAWLCETRNDLETPAIAAAPQIADALAALRGTGAAVARMSGSGATSFGLYAGDGEAKRAAATIATAQPSWYVKATRTIEKVDDDAQP